MVSKSKPTVVKKMVTRKKAAPSPFQEQIPSRSVRSAVMAVLKRVAVEAAAEPFSCFKGVYYCPRQLASLGRSVLPHVTGSGDLTPADDPETVPFVAEVDDAVIENPSAKLWSPPGVVGLTDEDVVEARRLLRFVPVEILICASTLPKLSTADREAMRGAESGLGNTATPYRQDSAPRTAPEYARAFEPATPNDCVPRPRPNETGCLHCPVERCACVAFWALFQAASLAESTAIDGMTRNADENGARHLCSKSILPCFVARLAAALDLGTETDLFIDLGCGNGSVLFQAALITGAQAVGVELNKHNASLARRLWRRIRPALELATGRKLPSVAILTGELADFVGGRSLLGDESDARVSMQRMGCKIQQTESHPGSILRPISAKSWDWLDARSATWTANKLMPLSVTNFMAESFRSARPGSRVACFEDFYPHGRASNRRRDPEAFDYFEMIDYEWSRWAVEWCAEVGTFFIHKRRLGA